MCQTPEGRPRDLYLHREGGDAFARGGAQKGPTMANPGRNLEYSGPFPSCHPSAQQRCTLESSLMGRDEPWLVFLEFLFPMCSLLLSLMQSRCGSFVSRRRHSLQW